MIAVLLVLLAVQETSGALATGPRLHGGHHDKFFATVQDWQVMTPRRAGSTGSSLNTRRHLGSGLPVHDASASFEIDAFNLTFMLDLHRNDDMFADGYKETRVNENGQHETTDGAENCYYRGSVLNATRSVVAVDTCDGLRGMFIVNGQRFQVLPAASHFDMSAVNSADSGGVPHIVYRQGDMDVSNFVLGSVKADVQLRRQLFEAEAGEQQSQETSVNAEGKTIHYVEWSLVNDNQMFEMFGAGTESHTASMANAVSATYSDESANFADHIIIVTLKAQLTFTSAAEFTSAIDVSDTDPLAVLESFSTWRQANFNDNDAASLVTGVTFSGNVLGLAFVGTMCGDEAVAINTYRDDLTTITTMTHELGHNFYMLHDTGPLK
jgi:hypothetical protein